MWPVGHFVFPLGLCLLTLTSWNIEKAFLQNEAASLAALINHQSAIQVSLPDPISFSDILTSGQIRVFFNRLFAFYPTFEFFIESAFPLFLERERWFIRARWSFLDKRKLNQHVLKIYFQVKRFDSDRHQGGGWRIIEIRAEKI